METPGNVYWDISWPYRETLTGLPHKCLGNPSNAAASYRLTSSCNGSPMWSCRVSRFNSSYWKGWWLAVPVGWQERRSSFVSRGRARVMENLLRLSLSCQWEFYNLSLARKLLRSSTWFCLVSVTIVLFQDWGSPTTKQRPLAAMVGGHQWRQSKLNNRWQLHCLWLPSV